MSITVLVCFKVTFFKTKHNSLFVINYKHVIISEILSKNTIFNNSSKYLKISESLKFVILKSENCTRFISLS